MDRQLKPLPTTEDRPPITRRYLRQVREEGVVHYLTPEGFTIILAAAMLNSEDGHRVTSEPNEAYWRGCVELIADSVRFLHSEDDYTDHADLADEIIPALMQQALTRLNEGIDRG